MPSKRRICSKCEVSLWRSDFPDNFEDDICFFCFLQTKIEDNTNKINSSNNTDRSSEKVNTAENLAHEIKDLRQEVKDLKQEVKDLEHEIKSIKNVNITPGKVNAVTSPPVSHSEKNISDNSTNDVSKQTVNSDMICSFIRSLRPGNTDKRSENPTDFHLDSNNTRPALTKKVSLGKGAERPQEPNGFTLVRNGTRPKPTASFQIPVSNPFSV